MILTITEVSSESSKPRRLFLRPGARASIGRTEWADWPIHHDQSMAAVHFEVACQMDDCSIRALGDDPIRINGAPVSCASIFDGDQILAGNSSFTINITDARTCRKSLHSPPMVTEPPCGRNRSHWMADVAASRIIGWVSLAESLEALVANTTTILEAVDRLSGSIKPDAEKLAAALRVVAYALPVQEGVQWALDCFDAMDAQSQDQLDSVAIESARAWLESKNSESIERARMAAERCESTSSAKWIAQAVAWSVGCQQESETTDAHTDDENQSADTPVWLIQRIDTHRRTASAIAACVLVLSLVGDASTVDVRARQFLQSATPRFQSLIASGT